MTEAEMNALPRGVSIIPWRDGRFAVSQRLKTLDRLPGMDQFPGGGVEPDEEPRAAAQRELKEETGLDVAQHRLVFLGKTPPQIGYNGKPYVGYRFGLVVGDAEELANTEPHKHTDWRWVDWDELRKLTLLDGMLWYAGKFVGKAHTIPQPQSA